MRVARRTFRSPGATAPRCSGATFAAINRLYGYASGATISGHSPDRRGSLAFSSARAGRATLWRAAPFWRGHHLRIVATSVMAGCEPEYLPSDCGGRGDGRAEFTCRAIRHHYSLRVWFNRNCPAALLLEITGPITASYRGAANATIGLAFAFFLHNRGARRREARDARYPGKYSFCCAENEEASPWEPLHVERGHARDASTVTVVGAEGTMNMNTHAKDAGELLRVIAETMQHPPSNEYCYGSEPWLVLSPEHAEILKAGAREKRRQSPLWSSPRCRPPHGREIPLRVKRPRA